MKPRAPWRMGLALICLVLALDGRAEPTASAHPSRAAQARSVEHAAQRLCARQAGEARRACEQQFAVESAALRAPSTATPPIDTRSAQ
ncbi:MAG: hypothetical protein K2Y51_16670 [Gammaproteobacteria bacterium]|jgi:hypothetical protein|nr:hypothetical protein [Gammaproteobacteria bacterium]